MDSDCVVVEAAAPESGAWTTCLARDAMAGYLGGSEDGLTVDDYFLEPHDAAERAVAWAAESGRTVLAGARSLDVLTADPTRWPRSSSSDSWTGSASSPCELL